VPRGDGTRISAPTSELRLQAPVASVSHLQVPQESLQPIPSLVEAPLPVQLEGHQAALEVRHLLPDPHVTSLQPPHQRPHIPALSHFLRVDSSVTVFIHTLIEIQFHIYDGHGC